MIKSYLKQLSPRERYLVILTACIVFSTLFYFALWQPMHKGIAQKRDHLKLQKTQLHSMQEQAQELRNAQRSSGKTPQRITNSSSLLSVIDRTAKQDQIKSTLQKAQPDGDNGVRLWMVNITFDQLIRWLDKLEREYGIYVSDIAIERDEVSGRVDSRILLRISL
jgi:general secretion pathway protein M